MKKILLTICLLLTSSFAEKYYDEAISAYAKIPSDPNEEVSWLEPYDKTYLPYNTCSDVKDFEIVRLQEMVKSYFQHKEHWYSIDHFHCLVSIVKITYRVTCLNKLQYEGVSYLFSDAHKLNEAYSSDDAEEEFYSHAHSWQDKPMDFLSETGVYYDRVNPEFSGYGLFDLNGVKQRWISQKVAYPDWKYMGKPGKKLAKPILFVHGLGDDYKSWGVTSTVDADKLCENDAGCAEMWPSLCEENFFPNSSKWFLQKAPC